ncbi:hypothetical protein GBA52_019557 [Prunus armeniaca]|nr:hypothetical protein GBA52_019557 [Prunus armeniaca]
MEISLLLFSLLLLIASSSAQMPGFVSLDCGGEGVFTDELGLEWTPDQLNYGETSFISVANDKRKQYSTLRHFPADSRKYCYTMNVTSRTRYLLRATFLYGNFDDNNVYPKFDISLGATHWSTIVISDATTIEMRELIFLATSPTASVCLSNATTGQPFISTLELRQFNGSVYYTDFEQQFYLSVSARINFGADDEAPIRYPDDPFDRIWLSDSVKKANFLVDIADGTKKVSTKLPIDVNKDERPPEKVMQTAVVGTNGSLTYRLNLDGFPGFGWAVTYFAEIEDLAPDESRKFRLVLPGNPELSKPIVNIEENAQGKYHLYEPGYTNLSLPFVLSFRFGKTSDSSKGPLLNAMEINKYLEKNDGSQDGAVISSFASHYSSADWAHEGGDPCLPVPWSWVECNSDPQPRVVKIKLSSKNLTGDIPSDLTKLNGLVELWLDGNSLTGPIPDFTGFVDLKIIHLENNQLTGGLPSSLTNLPSLKELYVQNNMLSGTVPLGLLNKVVLNYTGNVNLRKGKTSGSRVNIIIGTSVGAAVLVMVTIVSCILLRKGKKKYYDQDHQLGRPLPRQGLLSSKSDSAPTEAAHCFSYSEIEEATRNFEKKIGSGGFGVVYYGRMKDEREIAVKVLTSNSYQGKREFSNEVSFRMIGTSFYILTFQVFLFLSRCLTLSVSFYLLNCGFELFVGPLTREQSINWIKRLEIAEDAAKGLIFLLVFTSFRFYRQRRHLSPRIYTKCLPLVECSNWSFICVINGQQIYEIGYKRGTIVVLNDSYYSQKQSEKFKIKCARDVSFVDIIVDSFVTCEKWLSQAKLHIESGDIQGIIDPSLQGEYDIQSMWKIAEKALMCVQAHGFMRPSISEVLKEIQDAISMERDAGAARDGTSDASRNSIHSSLNLGSMDLGGTDNFLSIDESIARPTAR